MNEQIDILGGVPCLFVAVDGSNGRTIVPLTWGLAAARSAAPLWVGLTDDELGARILPRGCVSRERWGRA